MQKTLTDVLVRAIAAPASGRVEVGDTRCAGLTIRVTAAGVKSWSFRFRDPRSAAVTRATIGPYPEVSLATARDRATDMRKAVANGVNPVEANRGVSADHVPSDFGRGDVLIGQAAVDASMADATGTFESTLAKLAKGIVPARRVLASKSPAVPLPRPVASVRVPKALAPMPTPPPAPVVPLAVAADRVRVLAIRNATPDGAEAERDRAIASSESVEEFRRSLGAFTILSVMRVSRGGWDPVPYLKSWSS